MKAVVQDGVSPEKSSVVSLEKGLSVRTEIRVPMFEKKGKKSNPLVIESVLVVVVVAIAVESVERRWRSDVRSSTTSR